ncbi:MAG: trypsin-like peptidase domain-containing protein [Proteobacteria bacterium]|nr:trypsin-like peptidase domain-containing protein [Pseudomonadota bacterium]
MARMFGHGVAASLAVGGLLGLLAGGAAAKAEEDRCQAPEPVCAARGRVFRIASFDPVASAVLIGPGLLVTNRHVVADLPWADVFPPGGPVLRARVVATDYPGDLVLLRAEGLNGGPALEMAPADAGAEVYAVGVDVGRERVRVYAPGRIILPPAKGKPLARLHHSAQSQPGNSGGALVDGAGRLVGIVTSGGEGRHEAIGATQLAVLRARSGPRYADASRALGVHYRKCIEALEQARRGPAEAALGDAIAESCVASGNRQLFDLAGQFFGRARRVDDSVAMFERALEQDPNAINSRLGLAVMLDFSRRYGAAVPHLAWLLGVVPADRRILRLAVQVGKWGGNADLAQRALALLEKHHPDLAPRARDFLADDRPPPGPPG